MYEMLTGKRPFERESKIDTLRAHLEGQRPDLSALPKVARDVIGIAISRHPRDRFANARAMAEALDKQDSLGSFTSDGQFVEAGELLADMTTVDGAADRTMVDATPGYISGEDSSPPTVQATEQRLGMGTLALMVLLGVLVGSVGWWFLGGGVGSKPVPPPPSPQASETSQQPKAADLFGDPATPNAVDATVAPLPDSASGTKLEPVRVIKRRVKKRAPKRIRRTPARKVKPKAKVKTRRTPKPPSTQKNKSSDIEVMEL